MDLFVVDVEADGPIPGEYSMLAIGAVKVSRDLAHTFYGQLKPISEQYQNDALQITGFTRSQCLKFDDPKDTMLRFAQWIESLSSKPVFISDNNGFDWMFCCWYFWKFLGRNPFGYSSRRLGDLVCGMEKNLYTPWKKHRKTPATHHPVDDAKGNAEVLLYLADQGVKGIVSG